MMADGTSASSHDCFDIAARYGALAEQTDITTAPAEDWEPDDERWEAAHAVFWKWWHADRLGSDARSGEAADDRKQAEDRRAADAAVTARAVADERRDADVQDHKPLSNELAPPVGQLLPDEQDLAGFVAAVFKRADPKGIVSLRAFPDAVKNAKPLFIDPIALGDPQFLAVVMERAGQAANWPKPVVFCPPVVTLKDGRNAKADNVHEGVTLPVECDEQPNAALSFLREILGDPTVVVASGGEWTNPVTGEVEQKVHVHWRLKVPTRTPQEHAVLREARDLAAKLVGADNTAIPLVHPLRWPGSWHRKITPRLAKIIFESDSEIDLDEALDILREAAGAQVLSDRNHELEQKPHAATSKDIAAALKVIPNKDLKWCDWNHVGMATWQQAAVQRTGERYSRNGLPSPRRTIQ
jgi:hypothetical protein